MHVITFSQARAGLKQTMDDVCRDHEPTVITRQRGDHVVILSLEDYNSMAETMYLLGTESNAKRLRRSIAQHKAGKAVTKEISLNVSETEAEEQAQGTE
ncbi:MAG TPA: type II toxin-antitoxin system prevent-host-death family antitoxin [Pseudomonas sp.]|jgi:antitoxin YefM|uniref:type II toxin-antitoxin system Phd/YefM family antitoxin n=1 Tax=Pseudomonas sp. TaxID=306 RepID=UPI002ED9AC5B